MKTLFSLLVFGLAVVSLQAQQAPPAGSGAQLGVYLSEVNEDIADQRKLPGVYGALIEEVFDDSAAADADLRKGDVITGWNGSRVESTYALQRMVRESPVGRTVRLQVYRDGTRAVVEVSLKGAPEPRRFRPRPQPEAARPQPQQSSPAGPALGIKIQELEQQLADFFGLEEGQSGVLVASVFDKSVAKRAGIKAGDVITSINGRAVADPGALMAALRKAGKAYTLEVIRDREAREIKVAFADGNPPKKAPKKPEGKKRRTL